MSSSPWNIVSTMIAGRGIDAPDRGDGVHAGHATQLQVHQRDVRAELP